MTDILRADKISKVYNKRKVLDGVSIELKRGEVVGLLGPNGAGKTTSFYIIIGVIRPNDGKVFINDFEITRLPMHKRAREGISYLPQETSIFRKLTVYNNIYGILEMQGKGRNFSEKETDRVLELMGIKHLGDTKAELLSGGERRRVEIARSLVTNPKFLLLDEPFTGIDPKTRAEIQDIIKSLKELGIGVLITDHNVRETLEITDRAYIIYEGRIMLSGTSQELVKDPEVKRVYLGERFRL